MNSIPAKKIGSVTVTVPAVPAKTATPFCQEALLLPAASVQLVVKLSQLPVPPLITPLDVVLDPSQNCTNGASGPASTSRSTSLGKPVITTKLDAEKPAGTVPMPSVLSVSAPPYLKSG